MNQKALLQLKNPHMILAAIRARPGDVREVRVSSRRVRGAWEQVLEAAGECGIAITIGAADRPRDRGRGGTERAGAGLALVAPPIPVTAECLFETPKNGDLIVALDCLQDPQNVGAIFRAASFFGARGLVTTRDKSAPITATVCDISAGGVEYLPFHIATNLARTLQKARDAGYWILGTSEHAGSTVFDVDDRPWLVVIGNEQSGMRRLTQEGCDEICRIPPRGGVTSLNAAAATSAILAALTRPRN